MLLYGDFVLLYDYFDCNIFFGPVIRHEYCSTFANYYVGALLYEIWRLSSLNITHMEPQPKEVDDGVPVMGVFIKD